MKGQQGLLQFKTTKKDTDIDFEVISYNIKGLADNRKEDCELLEETIFR